MQLPIISRNPRAGFALIDPLIGLLAIAAVMVGVLNFWRLAEYKFCGKAAIIRPTYRMIDCHPTGLSYAPAICSIPSILSPEPTNRSTPLV